MLLAEESFLSLALFLLDEADLSRLLLLEEELFLFEYFDSEDSSNSFLVLFLSFPSYGYINLLINLLAMRLQIYKPFFITLFERV